MKRTPATLALVLVACLASSQEQSLSVTKKGPKIDGTVASNEYSFSSDLPNVKLYLNRQADILAIGMAAETAGWVAVGIGSSKMEGSQIFIGYVKDGKTELKPQVGSGHSHQDAAQDALVASAMSEAGGTTTLEISVKPDAFIKPGQKELLLIVAYGKADSFSAVHAFRTSLKVKFG